MDLQPIRKQLRLAMNGVIANSMRQKGMNYKLIFGVPWPEIKQIAASHTPDADLARALWQEDVREMKILATLLFPPEEMTHEEARRWVAEIPYPEIAEQIANNLLPFVQEADALAASLLSDTKTAFSRPVGFLLFAQLFKRGKEVKPAFQEVFLSESLCTLQPEDEREISWSEKRAAVQALRFFGRLSPENAQEALEIVHPESPTDEQQEFYEELKFEFAEFFPLNIPENP